MCGISAVYGEHAPIKSMLMTLNMLERGRKGCGVAYMCNGELVVIKEPIDPIEFFEKHYYELDVNVNMAISHNRQPSIGKVCYENTHPFVSCDGKMALIHNGHSFNGHLRADLISRGHRIIGETDSELLLHVLEDYLADTGNMIKALEKLMNTYLSGAIIVLTNSNELYACKSGYNMVHYAEVNGEVYIASTDRAVKSLLNIMGIDGADIKMLDEEHIIKVSDGKLRLYKVNVHKRRWNFTNWYSSLKSLFE